MTSKRNTVHSPSIQLLLQAVLTASAKGKTQFVLMAPRASTTTLGTGCEELDDPVYGTPRSSLDPMEVTAVLPIASSPGIHSSQIPGLASGRNRWAAPVNNIDRDDSLNEPPPMAQTSEKRLRQEDTPSQAPPKGPRIEYSTTAGQEPSPTPPEVRQLSESPLATPDVTEVTTSPRAVAMDEQPEKPTIDPDLYGYLLSSKNDVEEQVYEGTLSSTDNLVGLDAGMETSDQELSFVIEA
ncbi:unnamed protein product [Phaedon cochleariae]|uniref:Uncharacterized protein n=1 Tax=Phaedon cochleariae TaxID=80249 RepID=A0A9N9SIB7_PHACE|nr:unnamed protein product [Phaedon cochleariae]